MNFLIHNGQVIEPTDKNYLELMKNGVDNVGASCFISIPNKQEQRFIHNLAHLRNQQRQQNLFFYLDGYSFGQTSIMPTSPVKSTIVDDKTVILSHKWIPIITNGKNRRAPENNEPIDLENTTVYIYEQKNCNILFSNSSHLSNMYQRLGVIAIPNIEKYQQLNNLPWHWINSTTIQIQNQNIVFKPAQIKYYENEEENPDEAI